MPQEHRLHHQHLLVFKKKKRKLVYFDYNFCITGIFTQIAVLREQAGKPPIGFLNSVLSNLNGLKQNPLNDITTGESQGISLLPI
jgi:hypothetical protein